MPNLSRPLHRIFVVAACLMFAEALAVPISAARRLRATSLKAVRARLNSSATR